MTRPKTTGELRKEIMASEVLRAKSQEEICRSLGVNQATLSRILRGQFKRKSRAVEQVCHYANIICITNRPAPELHASLARLTSLARRDSPNARHAMKLIQIAAELLEGDAESPAES